MDTINKKEQKRLAKAITNEDIGLNSFGIVKKIQVAYCSVQSKMTKIQKKMTIT